MLGANFLICRDNDGNRQTDEDYGGVRIGGVWPAQRDSNPRSSESESAALSNCAMGGNQLLIILSNIFYYRKEKNKAVICKLFYFFPSFEKILLLR